ncbi:MAG: CotH kinase family protein, partial [Clostridia bacterium]|nr:CotH kinase family protein [Clostridia bacterium]
GNDSKKGAKQNFQLRFRAVYGLSKLKYQVFDNRDISTFNSLILKGGSEDYKFCGFRDELCTSLVDGVTNLSVQAYRPVILYLNGQYWGIYYIRERYDSEYVSQRLNVSNDSVNILKDFGGGVVTGSGKTFSSLISYCKKNDLRIQENYEYVMDRIDYLSCMDWYICRSYLADRDLANGRFYSSTEDDGKWHWCFFDLDWALYNNYEDVIAGTAKDDGNHAIIVALLKNPEFKDMFLKRYAYLMQEVLNEETIMRKIDEFVELLKPEIAQNHERYGLSLSFWEKSIERMRAIVRNGARDKVVLESIQSYFKLSDAEMTDYFGRVR